MGAMRAAGERLGVIDRIEIRPASEVNGTRNRLTGRADFNSTVTRQSVSLTGKTTAVASRVETVRTSNAERANQTVTHPGPIRRGGRLAALH